MIQVYTGDGKGKTTAAFGLAMRAAGHGFKVRIIQFMKGSTYTGELASAQLLGIEVFQFGRTCPHAAVIKSGLMECQRCRQCFIDPGEISDLDRWKTRLGWDLARASLNESSLKILVLDEIMAALRHQLLDQEDVLAFIDGFPEAMELVLTGRNAPETILSRAQLVTEMQARKHPYLEGYSSRRGIEF